MGFGGNLFNGADDENIFVDRKNEAIDMHRCG